MIVDGFTLLLAVFVVIMYVYLYLVRKSITIRAVKNPTIKYLVPFFCLLIIWTGLTPEAASFNEKIRSVLSVLIVLSFLMDAKGFSNDRIITHSFDNQGALYTDIEKIVLFQKTNEIRLNYFKNGRRGPMLKFAVPLEELVIFLSTRMNEEAELSIVIDEDQA